MRSLLVEMLYQDTHYWYTIH